METTKRFSQRLGNLIIDGESYRPRLKPWLIKEPKGRM